MFRTHGNRFRHCFKFIRMKKTFFLLNIMVALNAAAQWSNTTNLFSDSMHMPVTTSTAQQQYPIVLQSYPDGGYFVIWEDGRNINNNNNVDIYAQKYDANGNRLWAVNGVPVVNGPNRQHYVFASNQDYRNRSYAATDSAGGFYITYIDDSVNQYTWERICVQHMQSNGVPVFADAGYVVARPIATDAYSTVSAPLLVADGNKGFFISWIRPYYGQVLVYSYRDEGGGVMKSYGGGHVNFNAIQRTSLSACGIRSYIEYPGTTVYDYNIWPDGQGGCNVVMSMSGNTAGQGAMLTYNRLFRAKKESIIKTYFRNQQMMACPKITTYEKDHVYVLHTFSQNQWEQSCGGNGGPVYVVNNQRLTSNGYMLVDHAGYDYHFPKGVTINTGGNINVDLMAVTRRTYANNTVSDFIVQGYGYPSEIYDSVPYQRAAHNNPDIGYNPIPPDSMSALAHFRDTLLAAHNYYVDFSLAGGGNHVYSSALMSLSGDRKVRLQHLSAEPQGVNSFVIQYRTANKHGDVIGSELSTGFSGTSISYDLPMLKANNAGNALFWIRDYGNGARVSPILTGSKLEWGAMGRSFTEGIFNNSFYNVDQPHAALHPTNGTAVMAWKDNRFIPNTGENIFMRHLDALNTPALPAVKPVKPLVYGILYSRPMYFSGLSTKWTPVELFGGFGNPVITTVAEILDNQNLGGVQMNVMQHTAAVRRYNGNAYLDRNYTIVSQNAITSPVGLRLYFSETDFNRLKAADNSINTPGDLVVIKQPNNNLVNTPTTYAPVVGEKIISPTAWGTVAGGYYVELQTDGFSNFFIQKPAAVQPCVGGNVSIASGLSGSSYQWQVNTGGGFVNISDGGVYSGTNSANLQLTGAPTSWYGYQFRALVDGVTSVPYFLKFTATWTGSVNNAWENGGNWSCGMVPDANTDVIINSGTPQLNASTTIRTLTLGAGITITVKSGLNLTVAH